MNKLNTNKNQKMLGVVPTDADAPTSRDDNTQGATALTPSAANGGGSADFKKEGHRSGGLHIPSFLRGRRSRRNRSAALFLVVNKT